MKANKPHEDGKEALNHRRKDKQSENSNYSTVHNQIFKQ
jgi:hypothetical protein